MYKTETKIPTINTNSSQVKSSSV